MTNSTPRHAGVPARGLAMSRRHLVAATALLAAGPLALTTTAPAHADAQDPVAVALDWQATAIATVPFSPAKGLYLAFTSKAVDKAVAASLRRERSSEAAAIAQAAHDVLVAYFPAAGATLDDRLAQTLASVPDGPAEDRGVAIGADVAGGIIEWRTDDGRNDPSIVYSKTPGIGVWHDVRGMATPWLGFVARVVGAQPVPVDGPDPVGSAAYRADLAEVAAIGRAGADPDKAATATFFNVDAFSLYRAALITHLRSAPIGLRATTLLFADLDLATAEAFRQTWRLKFEVGFWRPAVAVAADDGDPLTEPVAGWTSVLPLPPYPDYPSGHGTITSAFAETVRCHLGDMSLTLNGAGGSRTYASLTALEDAALLSRIWGGIHFRDAMDDSFLIGHTVARQVCG
jgi:hypothetical protein